MAKVSKFDNTTDLINIPSSFDVYIIDMDSQTNVIELGKKMMEIDEGGHFIYCSSNPNNACQATKIHADYFIEKPIDPSELKNILAKIKSIL